MRVFFVLSSGIFLFDTGVLHFIVLLIGLMNMDFPNDLTKEEEFVIVVKKKQFVTTVLKK